MMIKKIEKEISQKIYNDSKNSLPISNITEPLLDKRLILEIFARNIAIYVSNNTPLEPNSFKNYEVVIENEKINISVGYIKKSENSEPTLTYGIL